MENDTSGLPEDQTKMQTLPATANKTHISMHQTLNDQIKPQFNHFLITLNTI